MKRGMILIVLAEMTVLFISNGFADSKVHCSLTKAIDDKGVRQIVYCPVREKRLVGRNRFEGKQIEFFYSNCIKSWYKYLYHYKSWILYRDMKRKINLKKVDIITATTLFSDGALALKASKDYGIPYIVAVRNTDINIYIKRLRHTYAKGREIALNAKKIIFISRAELDEFLSSDFVAPILSEIKHKVVLQPNGIDDYWIKNVNHNAHGGHDVLYVGDFSANKNVVRLAKAVLQLKQEKGFEDIRLLIIGGEKKGGARKNDGRTQQIVNKYPEVIKSLGFIYEIERISDIMNSCAMFAMPSIHETFGLVYLEALSQNLPVLYTKGQGIDGLFDDTVGLGVDAFSVEEIKSAIKTILFYKGKYGNKNVDFCTFNWDTIADNYLALYKESICSN